MKLLCNKVKETGMRYLDFQETDIPLPLPSASLTVTPWECPVISGFMAGTKGFLGQSSNSWTPQWNSWNIVSLFRLWRQLELWEGMKASCPDWSCVMCHCLALWGMCMCVWGRRKGKAHVMGFWGSQREMVKSVLLTVLKVLSTLALLVTHLFLVQHFSHWLFSTHYRLPFRNFLMAKMCSRKCSWDCKNATTSIDVNSSTFGKISLKCDSAIGT